MDDVFVYFVNLPRKIKEAVCLGPDGCTIYIDARLDEETKKEAYQHALWHIENGDFWRDDVQQIEGEAHVFSRNKKR